MSGGRYDYLCFAEPPQHLQDMAERLAVLAPGSAASRDTAALVELFRDDALREVWRAVEWADSGDCSQSRALDEITAYDKRAVADAGPLQPTTADYLTAAVEWISHSKRAVPQGSVESAATHYNAGLLDASFTVEAVRDLLNGRPGTTIVAQFLARRAAKLATITTY